MHTSLNAGGFARGPLVPFMQAEKAASSILSEHKLQRTLHRIAVHLGIYSMSISIRALSRGCRVSKNSCCAMPPHSRCITLSSSRSIFLSDKKIVCDCLVTAPYGSAVNADMVMYGGEVKVSSELRRGFWQLPFHGHACKNSIFRWGNSIFCTQEDPTLDPLKN